MPGRSETWSKPVTERADPAHDSEDPYRPAMSLLDFYVNNAGRDLSAKQRAALERAKAALQKRIGDGNGSNERN